MLSRSCAALAIAAAAPSLRAQSFEDLTIVRNPELPYVSLLEIEAGLIGAKANTEDEAAGLEDAFGWDGHVFFHDAFGSADGSIDVYAGRDGGYLALRDGQLVGNDTVTRLELRGRLWQFYREGAYRGDTFVPIGRYEGKDFEAYLGFGREASPGLYMEFGPFYRRNTFDRNDDTDPTYVIPVDYDAYGGRIFLEQKTVQHDRRRGIPQDGYILTVMAEREWNESDEPFGSAGFTTQLPSAVWRGRGRLEWYVPQTDDSTWEIFVLGAYSDENDRVWNYEAQRPQGNLWVDGQIRFRLHFGETFTLVPFVHGQFVRILEEDGAGADKKTFFGGGAETFLHLSDSISVNAWYSYLDNESRPPVRIDEDVHGEHMFFGGMVFRFGGRRR